MMTSTQSRAAKITAVAAIIVGLYFLPAYPGEPAQSPPKYKIGFSERFRIETWDNASSLSNAANAGNSYVRFRSSLSGQWFPSDKMELCLKEVNEFRNYFVPTDRQFNIDEFFIDQLYIKLNRIENLPLTLTVGRQNLNFGEGFVIFDGGPLDGSRSAYLNAVRIDCEFLPQKTLTAFYSVQNRHDDMLPVINDKNKAMLEQNEKVGGLYFAGDFNRRNVQVYYLRKDSKTATAPALKTHLNAVGERTVIKLANNLSLAIEWAYEFGTIGDADISAFGGYGYVSWLSGWPKSQPIDWTAGTIYLSGDDPHTPKHESWDPIYGRWPKWSELYIITLSKENGAAYWTNLFSLYGKVQINISKNVKFNFDYHHLNAAKNDPTRTPFPGGTGTHRGELRIAKLTYQLTKAVSGHIQWENFYPGSFYFSGADHCNWMRIEFNVNL